MAKTESQGVSGGVRGLLRLEGAALLAAALMLYAQAGAGWTLFLILFLVSDLSFAFYLFGARIGAFAYNTMHSTIGPFLLVLASQMDISKFGLVRMPQLFAIALVWFAHVGFDRALGYGLKYAAGFGDTHLGAIGKRLHEATEPA